MTTGAETAVDRALVTTASESATSRPGRSWSRQVAADSVGLVDAAAVAAGAAVPAVIYGNVAHLSANWPLVAQSSVAAAIIVYMCLRSWNMYDTSRMNDFPVHPGKLLGALMIGITGVIGLGLPQAIHDSHMAVWFITWLAASNTLLVLNRITAHALLAHFTAAGHFHERVAVFGAGEIARRVKDHLSNQTLSIQLAGVFDDRAGEDRLDSNGLQLSGKLDDLIDAARSGAIDQIVIALPQGAEARIGHVARRLEQLPCSVHIVTHISSDLLDTGFASKVSNLGPIGLLDVKRKPLADWATIVKRAEDVLFGLAFLAIFVPLLPLIAFAIKLDSPGPVLFRQRRRGLNQQIFEVLKFRTMGVMEDGRDVRQATPGDLRVTRVGRILRRTSLDELPQIINVLKGEMSLVGPRPHALVQDEQFGDMVETYANRQQVKPGITGLAQVLGHRGQTETTEHVEARVAADIEYIRNWSLSLDMKILAQTIKAVIRGENAY